MRLRATRSQDTAYSVELRTRLSPVRGSVIALARAVGIVILWAAQGRLLNSAVPAQDLEEIGPCTKSEPKGAEK